MNTSNTTIKNEWYNLVMEQNEALNEYFETYKAAVNKFDITVIKAKEIYDRKAAAITQRLRELKNMAAQNNMVFC